MKIDNYLYRHVVGPYMEDSVILPISFARRLYARGLSAGDRLPYEEGAWQVIEAEIVVLKMQVERNSNHLAIDGKAFASAWGQSEL